MSGPGSHPRAVAVSGDRMGIINDTGAQFRVNDSSAWTLIVDGSANASAIAVSDSGRMAFIDTWGAFFRGSDSSAWTTMTGADQGPRSVSVSGARMGLVTNAGGAMFRLDDGSGWTTVVTGTQPSAIAIAGGGSCHQQQACPTCPVTTVCSY
jgi:hypothetical protein